MLAIYFILIWALVRTGAAHLQYLRRVIDMWCFNGCTLERSLVISAFIYNWEEVLVLNHMITVLDFFLWIYIRNKEEYYLTQVTLFMYKLKYKGKEGSKSLVQSGRIIRKWNRSLIPISTILFLQHFIFLLHKFIIYS